MPPRRPLHVLAKPSGPICNLDCQYCYFLSKEALYPNDRFRMSDELLEAYLCQLMDAQPDGEVTVAWQGGEPTLMGVEFFRKAVAVAERARRPGQRVLHTIQTNGTLLDDRWGELFAKHDFLVGISIDGPPAVHDTYRVDKRGRPTAERVLAGLATLQRHGVDVNVLTTVHAGNEDRPLEVYRYLRDELGVAYLQLIPVVERLDGSGSGGDEVTDRSVDPRRWGAFLIDVFDEWLRKDVGRVFVQLFDAALANWAGIPASLCLFRETCGDALVLEHNGDLYSCDHFVEPVHFLGNLSRATLAGLAASPQQVAFGRAKSDALPRYCRRCEVRFACHGECPKNRFVRAPDGEEGLNYLCTGYRAFFNHVDGPMRLMAELLRQGRDAAAIHDVFAAAGRNEPCPCGSGRKAKACHQR